MKTRNIVISLLCCLGFSGAQAANKAYYHNAVECYEKNDQEKAPVLRIGLDAAYLQFIDACDSDEISEKTCQKKMSKPQNVSSTLQVNLDLEPLGSEGLIIVANLETSLLKSFKARAEGTLDGEKNELRLNLSEKSGANYGEQEGSLELITTDKKSGEVKTKSVQLSCDNNIILGLSD